MADKIEGFLEVGCNEAGEVVINHSDIKPDENGVGHIVFSPAQARNLAQTLWKCADEAEGVDVAPEYFISFTTEKGGAPKGKLDAVRVRLDMIRTGDMNREFRLDLCDHPLYSDLKDYVKANQ